MDVADEFFDLTVNGWTRDFDSSHKFRGAKAGGNVAT
jgi:hypothetical protein